MTITEPHRPNSDELLDLFRDIERSKPIVAPAATRLSDPPTSHEARDSISDKDITELQANILALFIYGPMADYRLIEKYKINAHLTRWKDASESSIRSRRAELVKMGYLVATTIHDTTPTGGRTTVWKYAR